VASIFEQAQKHGIQWKDSGAATISLEKLVLPEEMELIRKMIQWDEVLEESVRELEPHHLVFYLLEMAGEFHRYYNRHRFISDDSALTSARLLLARTVQKTIRRGLDILGVDAPMKMAARADDAG
jgi:arginyl-tRNA synthetase